VDGTCNSSIAGRAFTREEEHLVLCDAIQLVIPVKL
jgi:hypothetical protein